MICLHRDVCSLQAQRAQTLREKRCKQLRHQYERHGKGLTRTWYLWRQVQYRLKAQKGSMCLLTL